MEHLLGIDIGTFGTKGVLMNKKGKIYARAGGEYSMDMHPSQIGQNKTLKCGGKLLSKQ